MTELLDSRPTAADTTAPPDETVLWHHAAFCRIGLPLRTPRGAWQRAVGDAAIRIEPGAAGHALPGGIVLRLVLLHICDAAIRSAAAVVEMGADAAVLAETLGISAEAAGLADQVERMLAARIAVSLDGGAELGVFDARGRPRTAGSAWRPSVRLNGGFQASLAGHAVPLDRRVVERLRDAPLAFDAYAWIRQSLHGRAPEAVVTAGWDELVGRFGTSTQDVSAFRPAFEAALRSVFAADLALALAVDDDGVSVRRAPPAVEEPAPSSAEAAPDGAPAAPPREIDDPADRIEGDTISLRSHLTGLAQVIWLRRGYGEDSALVGVTPGARFDPDRLTVLAVEPIVMEVSGGLGRQELDRVSAWIMANRDLIDDFWAGEVTSYAEIGRRIRKVAMAGWR